MMPTHYSIYARARLALLSLLMLLLAACSGDYRNAIPKGSTAVMAIDAGAVLKGQDGEAGKGVDALARLLQASDLGHMGIDFGQPLYGFETPDGTLGFVLPVGSDDDVDEWLKALQAQGTASKTSERKGCKFALLGGSVLLGYTASAMVAVGPVLADGQAAMQRRMGKWLGNGDEEGIKDTRLFEKLESMEGAVRLVARSDALPEQLAALLTLGAPKGVQPQEVYVSLALRPTSHGYSELRGGAFAFDEGVNASLRKAMESYKPLEGGLLDLLPDSSHLVMACGVEGYEYLRMLRSNETMRTMLFGANTVLDIDKMLRSVEGDLVVGVTGMGGEAPGFCLLAEAKDKDWLADVGYWKRSCPEGVAITEGDTQGTFRLRGKDYNLDFGMDAQQHLYIANIAPAAKASAGPNASSLTATVRKAMTGKRLAVALDAGRLVDGIPVASSLSPVVKALAGGNGILLYVME